MYVRMYVCTCVVCVHVPVNARAMRRARWVASVPLAVNLHHAHSHTACMHPPRGTVSAGPTAPGAVSSPPTAPQARDRRRSVCLYGPVTSPQPPPPGGRVRARARLHRHHVVVCWHACTHRAPSTCLSGCCRPRRPWWRRSCWPHTAGTATPTCVMCDVRECMQTGSSWRMSCEMPA